MTERRRSGKRRHLAPPEKTYTRELADQICRELSEGKALKTICQELGVFQPDVYSWVLDDHDGFATKYARARQLMAFGWADELTAIADQRRDDYVMNEEGKMVPDFDHIARMRLRLDTRKWLLSKMLPKVYGDKVVAEITGKDGAALEAPTTTINVLALAPEQREQLKHILLQATKGKSEDDQ